MRPDTNFHELDPMAQYHSKIRLMYPWSAVYEWWRDRANRDTWYHAVESYWFRTVTGPNDPYRKLYDELRFKPGVDRESALRHVDHVLSSMEKHEWKIGTAAMLLQEWCEPLDFAAKQQIERDNFEKARAVRLERERVRHYVNKTDSRRGA